MSFRWRERTGHPPIEIEVYQVDRRAWQLFAPHHYLSKDIVVSAQCYVAEVGKVPVAFVAMRYQPLVPQCWMVHRLVTLPEWQGLGMGPALMTDIAREYQQRTPHRVRIVTRHRGLVLALARSPLWRCVRPMGSPKGRAKGRGAAHHWRRTATERSFGQATARGEVSASFEWRGP